MKKEEPRLTPKNRYWYNNLPDRETATGQAIWDELEEADEPKLYGDLNHIDDEYLEISRASSKMRGWMIILSGGCVLPMSLLMLIEMWPPEPANPDGSWMVVQFISWAFAFLVPLASLLSIRLDVSIPRDEPVGFNRHTNKVYLYEYKYNYNPFGRWHAQTRVFDWDTIQAEMTRERGSNGVVYAERYGLDLASSDPDTGEVVDRFTLKKGMTTTMSLAQMWAYVRTYMAHGPDAVPACPLRDQRVSFRRSLFQYVRVLDPSREGRAYRARLRLDEWFFDLLFLSMIWFTLPLGLGHYIAMRCAPKPKWPPELDIESSSV